MTRPINLTRYKLTVLRTLDWSPGTARVLGGHPSNFERACREMEQAGLVARNLHGQWRIRPAGREALVEPGWIK